MKNLLINATCKNCGGNLEVDKVQKILRCPFCDSVFILDNLNCSSNNVSNAKTYYEMQLERASHFEKLEKNSDAESIYRNLINEYPENYIAYERLWKLSPYIQNSDIYKCMIKLNPSKILEYQEQYANLVRIDEQRKKCIEMINIERGKLINKPEKELSGWFICAIILTFICLPWAIFSWYADRFKAIFILCIFVIVWAIGVFMQIILKNKWEHYRTNNDTVLETIRVLNHKLTKYNHDCTGSKYGVCVDGLGRSYCEKIQDKS